ncbi:hypothetical protein V1509DRAFT_612987 [Lipomyces kononenkoae]
MCMMRHTSASNPENDNTQSHLYHLFKYLFSFIQLVRAPSLELVQSGLLLVVFELGDSLHNAASMSISICARLAYALGLNVNVFHVDALHFPEWVELEERQRVWLGIYMLDRMVLQVIKDFKAPYVVEELDNNTNLPVDDLVWDAPPGGRVRGPFQATLSTPVETKVSYFAREIQAIRLLGNVQKLADKGAVNLYLQEFEGLENALILFVQTLFAQTRGTGAVFCGASAIALTAIVCLLKVKARCARRQLLSPSEDNIALEHCKLALSSFVGITCQICTRFNAVATKDDIGLVPLAAVISTAESSCAAVELSSWMANGYRVDYEPLKVTLAYFSQYWKLSAEYLRHVVSLEMSLRFANTSEENLDPINLNEPDLLVAADLATEIESDEESMAGVPFQALTGMNHVLAVATVDPFDTCPVKLTSQHQKLLHHWLSIHATMMLEEVSIGSFNPMRDISFPLDLSNASSFNTLMAHSAAHLAHSQGATDSPDALTYKAEALRILNIWFNDPLNSLSDDAFAAVVRLLTFEEYLKFQTCYINGSNLLILTYIFMESFWGTEAD